MRFALGVVLLLVCVSCGGGSPPSSAAAPSGGASSMSSATPATAAPDQGPCGAALTDKRPAGWVDVGQLVVTVKDDMPVAYELRDAGGAKVDSGEIQTKSARAAADAVAQPICKVGGALAVFAGKPTKDGTMTLTVVKPAREDEGADMTQLCKAPDDVAGFSGLEDAQKRRAAFDIYGERLTSRKWRGFVVALRTKLRAASDDAARAALMKSAADALDAGHGKNMACWFADVLRKP